MPPIAANDGRIVGIIYPPPEVRNIVDKTASFVARNGPEFEQRIKQNELNKALRNLSRQQLRIQHLQFQYVREFFLF